MEALAIVLEEPGRLALSRLPLDAPGTDDVVVETAWSGISTGTERLLYSGRMPDFPGMGYPLVPGYETVGEIVEAGPDSGYSVGQRVFAPGATCYGAVRGLFGGAASHLVVKGARVAAIPRELGDRGVLLALAATAQHARSDVAPEGAELIVGHGVLGRLLARLSVAAGGAPTVWERDPQRAEGAEAYLVTTPEEDARRDYRVIYDVSGDPTILDVLIARLAPGGEIVLAGFYERPLAFAFPPAFMREARLRVAAQWRPGDLKSVIGLVEDGRLSLEGLITHRRFALQARDAYPIAFDDPRCLKMVLDWRAVA
ncbi:chlorophyll synthesis pathway protein BchC [Methylocystis sp. SB2]|uniref:chlorophyll synthesis pathway protein BchC n=1 Tax=Methylocystis sp. (strain SB2) TaxID=743836 RepID=UPI0004A4607A|nr:chlorophyll synthesis pathway protein BchC [Methylocystis sp. SB2]ULO25492.1 chlorophyll synthesis pathway protein BchC [Methylocystis sp. SB2]